MKSTIQIIAFVALVAGPIANGSITVPESVDVGKVRGNELRKFEFVLSNPTSEDITVVGIKTSCACTNVELQGSKKLVPGAKGTVTGDVNFGGALGNYETKVAITAQSTNGKSEEVTIPVRGKVIADMVLEKSRIDLGKVDIGAGPQVVTVDATRGNSGELWEDVIAKGDSDHLSASTEATPEKARLTVRFDPSELPISTFRGNVKIQLFHDDQPLANEIDLPVTARITGPLKATPSSIYLGAVEPGQSVSRSITIRSTGLDLQELVVEEQPLSGRAEIKRSDKQSAMLTFSLTPTQGEKTISQALTLLHKPSHVRLRIPILGIIAN